MTVASQELHLTQSGVSQHIKSLEDVLGVKLFDRVKQRLIPTDAAGRLFRTCTKNLYDIEHALSEIKGGEKQLSGTVRIGMPIEFGNNVVLPRATHFCNEHQEIRLSLSYDYASVMNQSLLAGELDFAFVDEYSLDHRIKTEKVYEEELYLCASVSYLKTKGSIRETKKYFESLEYVDYKSAEIVLRSWFKYHYGSQNLNLKLRADLMDVHGIGRMIEGDLGAGVLPGHYVNRLEKRTKIHRFKGSGKILKNKISVAFLSERTASHASIALREYLTEGLKLKMKERKN